MSQSLNQTRPNFAFLLLLVLPAGLMFSERLFADSLTFQVSISNERAIARVFRAFKGDHVTIDWSTDKPATVHVHAYEIEQEVLPGTFAQSQFEATVTGRFPIEAHFGHGTRGKILAYLEVRPR
jgi:hypothetical protein